MAGLNPTVRRRELASRLRRLREARSLTVEQVAYDLLCSAPKISRLETGARSASLRDIRDLARLYEASEDETKYLLELAREARQSGWWTQYYDSNYAQYVGLEQDAASIISFSRYSIPALLQTREYAQATFENNVCRMDNNEVERYVEGTAKRQELLTQVPTLQYAAFLDEAVLHRRVGDVDTMRAQLARLRDVANDSNVSMRILPFTAGLYSIVESNFHFLEFNDAAQQRPLLFIEGIFGDAVIERSKDIELARKVHEGLRRIALSTRQSLKLIIDIANSDTLLYYCAKSLIFAIQDK